jgi:hypothetical protein
LVDSDSSVRQAAVIGLWLLTHHVALDGKEWADMSNLQSATTVYQRWVHWWKFNGSESKIHGMADCASPDPIA